MYCPKCGSKISSKDIFCNGCGRSLKEEKIAKIAPKSKTPKKLTLNLNFLAFKKYLLWGLPLLIIILLLIFFTPKVLKAFKPKKKTVKQTQPKERLEARYLEEAKKEAQAWALDARLFYYYLSFEKFTDANPYISWQFYSANKNQEFEYMRYQNGNVKSSTQSAVLKRSSLPEFPPKLRIEDALEKAKVAYEAVKREGQNVIGWSGSVSEINEHWSIFLSIDTGFFKPKVNYCKIPFVESKEQKSECQPLSAAVFDLKTDLSSKTLPLEQFDFLDKAEDKCFSSAKKEAEKWSSKVFFNTFYFSLKFDPEMTHNQTSYFFYSPEKEDHYLNVSCTEQGVKSEEVIIYKDEERPTLTSFPASLKAQEAGALMVQVLNELKPKDSQLRNIIFWLKAGKNFWEISAFLYDDKDNLLLPDCRLYFDKKVECVD